MTDRAGGWCSRKLLACAALTALAGTGCVAWRVAPWSGAAFVPVQLWLEAPAETSLRLSWGPDDAEAVPMVPQTREGQTNTELWLAELPPRPTYQLSIDFARPVRQAVLRELVLVDVRRLDEPLLRLSAEEIRRQSAADGVQLVSTDAGMVVDCPASGRLSLTTPVPSSPGSVSARFAAIWLSLSAVVMLGALIVAAFFRQARSARPLADRLHPDRIASPRLAPLCCAFGLGLAFHLSVIAALPALYNPFDPLVYFQKAVFLAEAGTYTTHTPFWELDRLPGYPVFLAACLKLFGYHLKAVTLSQGFLFGTALFALAVSLRHWISTWYTAAAVLILLVSPVGLQHTLGIGTESLFSSLAAFALAAFFEHQGTSGRRSRLWLAAFGVVTTAAVFVRPNAVVLLVAPLTTTVPAVIAALKAPGGWTRRLRGVAGGVLPFVLPAACLAAGLGGWGVRNDREHGMPAPTSMVGVSLVEGLTQSGIFDARALRDEALYAEYLRDKYDVKYAYCGWNIRGSVRRQLAPDWPAVPPDFIAVLDQHMQQIAGWSEVLSPWELKLAGLLRTAGWGIELPSRYSYSRNGIWSAPRYFGNHPRATAAWKDFCTRTAPAKIGKALPLVDLEEQELATQWPLGFMQSPEWGDWHQRAYRGFLGAGLVWGFCILWYNAPALAVPALVFLANIGLNTWLLNMQGRYLLTLESLVVFQALMGLHFLIRSWREKRGKLSLVHSAPVAAKGIEMEARASRGRRAA